MKPALGGDPFLMGSSLLELWFSQLHNNTKLSSTDILIGVKLVF